MIATPTHDKERVWLPLSAVAKEYNRHPRVIQRWCSTGFIIELGFTLRKDETGHWIIGVPHDKYTTFATL